MSAPASFEAYQATRDPGVDRSVLCHAPFTSLNFEQSGRVTVCCYNRRVELGRYPEQGLDEIWSGEPARVLRQAFLDGTEATGCDLCFHQLAHGAHRGTLMRNFDRFARDEAYAPGLDPVFPRVLEFEIANTCNLACVMCGGHWSSKIRADREGLPPLVSPYDDAFVTQLEPYLAQIHAAKFLGGEPFLIKRYYAIWERIRTRKPDAELTITTNATRIPARAWALLEDLNAHIVVSIDALTRDTYQGIRHGARFDDVMSNLAALVAYAERRNTSVTLTVCPLTLNWRELPRFLDFCAEHGSQLHFNTVLRPPEISLASLSTSRLSEVVDHLDGRAPEAVDWRSRQVRDAWQGLVTQLRSWLELKRGAKTAAAAVAIQVPEVHTPLPGEEAWIETLGTAHRLQAGAEQLEHDDLRVLLPSMPDALPSAGLEPLLLAAHRMLWGVDRGEAGPPVPRETLEAERRLLVDCIAGVRSIDSVALESLEGWLRGLVEGAETRSLFDWTRRFLVVLRHAGSGGRDAVQAASLDDATRQLANGIPPDLLDGLRESARKRGPAGA